MSRRRSRKGKDRRPRRPAARRRVREPLGRHGFARRLALGILLWVAPVAVLWVLLTPRYNVFLTRATEKLVHLSEVPNVTRLVPGGDVFRVIRSDRSVEAGIGEVRLTDAHFPVVMLAVLFLAVPGQSFRERLVPLGWAVLILALFQLALLFCWVKFIYATQLGAWSVAHYGTLARNFWATAKHLMDLPFKLGLPLLLWSFFYLKLLVAPQASEKGDSSSRTRGEKSLASTRPRSSRS